MSHSEDFGRQRNLTHAVSINFLNEPRKFIPSDIVLYAALALLDFALTIFAIQMGHSESNPILAPAVDNGLFDFLKLSLTLLVVCTAFYMWRKRLTRHVMAGANALMVSVIVYHVSLHMG